MFPDMESHKLLVSSMESKFRLKWSHDLHNRFIDAVNQLGGSEKATPKGLMKVMEIPGLTLYHLKSHLQKFRLGKRQEFDVNKQDETLEAWNKVDPGDQQDITEENDDESNGILQIKEEDQKKLHKEIEVQRNLEMRIEAEGKYFESVSMKAQETFLSYRSSRPELYRVESMVNRSCISSSFSGLTQEEGEGKKGFLKSKKPENRGIRVPRSSVDSSLTSLESSEVEIVSDIQSLKRRSIEHFELELMEIKPEEVLQRKKRSWNDAVYVEEQ